ncbi:restriction endonuclease [Streptomyces sp. NPDC004232]|uniref:restriction endonuclease n=1 Tax=Streptomyces sp. NPDC004232 TaxID=3154454 RepID=UPI00339E4D38
MNTLGGIHDHACTVRSRIRTARIGGCGGCAAATIFFWALIAASAGNVGPAIILICIAGIAGLISYSAYQGHKQCMAEQYQVRMLQSQEIALYHAMGPGEFEHAIAYLCERDGCSSVQVVGGAGDLGADVIASAPDGRRIVIQCKRYRPTTKVGSPDMQRFGGTCYSVHGAQVAAVVTSSVFTKPAADYGVRQGIRLVDTGALAGWATRTGPAPWM